MMEPRSLNFNLLHLHLCWFFVLCYSCSTHAVLPADSSYTLLHTIYIKSKSFTTDKLGQVYVITDQNEVIKFDPNGRELFRFNNNKLGNLQHIDVTDPFNVLLYYPEYFTVLTLDRTLNISGEYDLTNLNLTEVKAIGMSNDNNVWLYDEVTFKLRKVDRKAQVLLESVELNLMLQYTPHPNFILERENIVYLNNPQTGVLVFDNYAKYIKTLDFKGLNDFQVFNNQLIFRKDEKLMVFHLQPLVLQTISMPEGIEPSDKIRIQQSKLFVRKADRVLVYAF